jgi:hypothetical protein
MRRRGVRNGWAALSVAMGAFAVAGASAGSGPVYDVPRRAQIAIDGRMGDWQGEGASATARPNAPEPRSRSFYS